MGISRFIKICLFWYLSILITACGGGGGEEGEELPPTSEGAGWITIDSASSSPTEAHLAGEAFISPDWYRCCSGSAEDTGVTVIWTNTATSATGPAKQYVRYSCLPLLNCWVSEHTWSATIPIVSGANPIVVVASDPSGNIGRAYITASPGPPPPDDTAPVIVSTWPESEETGVGVKALITATFSEAMDEVSITEESFTLTDAANIPVLGTVTYSGTTATFDPDADLAFSTRYHAQIASSVRDLAGNTLSPVYSWTFTTGDMPDSTPPAVVSVIPQVNDACAAPDELISATFSEPIDAATVHDSSFVVSDAWGDAVIGNVWSIGSVINFEASLGLAYDAAYSAMITTAVTDLAGNALASDFKWNFSTQRALAGTWQPVTTAGSPVSRSGHTAVWGGTEMIIWGGTGISGKLNSGGLYNPSADSWQPTSTSGAPSARSYHTAVWTGSKMIIWGGIDQDGNYLNTGALYDPATDTWEAVAEIDAPSARRWHTAVWTGSEMLIWGGQDQTGNALNTGARYSAATNEWWPISTLNAPPARSLHTAVWTGTELVVWGGTGLLSNQGGRYDPVADTWQSMSVIGAPTSPRSGHTAIWTGDKMVVWGGYDGSYTQSGGIYTPATDTWHLTSLVCAPAGRTNHVAVWTGTHMVVWGGKSFSANLNSGGVNDVSNGSWQGTNFLAAPPAMGSPTGIWTGNSLIVWGAYALSSDPGVGGTFTP